MELYINTASYSEIILELRSPACAEDDMGEIIIKKKIKAPHKQAEKLLPALEMLLKQKKKKLADIKKIIVENRGEGFTSLRIGVATANILAYALNIPVAVPGAKPIAVVSPLYNKPPSVTKRSRG